MPDPKARQRWLAERRASIGASDAATAMGLNPYQTRLGLWRCYMEPERPDREESEPMFWGTQLQDIIALVYAEQSNRKIQNLGQFRIIRNPAFSHLHATLDYLMAPCDGLEGPGVLEIKNVGQFMAGEWKDNPPLMYQIQLQIQMLVSRCEWGVLCALVGGQKLVYWQTQRSLKFIWGYAVPRLDDFWYCVRKGIEPDAVAGDSSMLNTWKTDGGDEMTLPGDAVELDESIQCLQGFIKRYESVVDDAKAKIKQILGEHTYGTLPDESARYSFKANAKGTRVLRRSKL